MRFRAPLLLSIFLATLVAQAGDCVQRKVSDPILTYLFSKAVPDQRRISKTFGRGLVPCTKESDSSLSEAQFSAMAKDRATYSVSSGDRRCGAHFPSDQAEHATTDRLKKAYEDFIQDDLRVWVTSPKGESAILVKPYLTFIDIPQSMLECFKRGPKDFTCPKSMPRNACCRSRLMKRYTYAATYKHPFEPETDITVTSTRPELTVHRSDGTEEKLNCQNGLFYF